MARWAHADTLDGSLNVIKNNCTKLAVVAAYSAGDSYATVTGGSNILGGWLVTEQQHCTYLAG